MNRLEKFFVLATFFGQMLFVPLALWALTKPALRQNMHEWADPISLVLAPVSLIAMVLLFRDLALRVRAGQVLPVWVVAILLSGAIALIPYAILHAFKPRRGSTQHSVPAP